MRIPSFSFFFFFNDTATTEIYTLSLHDALPIFERLQSAARGMRRGGPASCKGPAGDSFLARRNAGSIGPAPRNAFRGPLQTRAARDSGECPRAGCHGGATGGRS